MMSAYNNSFQKMSNIVHGDIMNRMKKIVLDSVILVTGFLVGNVIAICLSSYIQPMNVVRAPMAECLIISRENGRRRIVDVDSTEVTYENDLIRMTSIKLVDIMDNDDRPVSSSTMYFIEEKESADVYTSTDGKVYDPVPFEIVNDPSNVVYHLVFERLGLWAES